MKENTMPKKHIAPEKNMAIGKNIAIVVKDLCFQYGKREILRSVSFHAHEGECVGILGNNGAGKSTLISCINRIKKPSHGQVTVNGENVFAMPRQELARHIAYVAQKNELSQTTVFDSVLLGRKPYFGWAPRKEDILECEEMLAHLSLSAHKMQYIDELSGGEVQKVMLARAFVQEPKVLLLDEPTNNLDPKNQYETMELVRNFAKEKKITVLMVLHDLNLALRYCDSFMFIRDGRIFSHGGSETVSKELLEQVYGITANIVTIEEQKVVLIR